MCIPYFTFYSILKKASDNDNKYYVHVMIIEILQKNIFKLKCNKI